MGNRADIDRSDDKVESLRFSGALARHASPVVIVCGLALGGAACGSSASSASQEGHPVVTTEADGGDAEAPATLVSGQAEAGMPAADAGVPDTVAEPPCTCAHGACVSGVDLDPSNQVARCACDRGWAGATCDVCAAGRTGAECAACAAGYFASIADPTACNPDPCVGNPCGANGTCSIVSDRTGVDVAACACSPSRTGDHCQSCADGYLGTDCSRCAAGYDRTAAGECVLAACATVSCGAHGRCADRAGTGVCLCETGWTGASCGGCAPGYVLQQNSCVPNLCAGVVCGPGTCIAITGVPGCSCPRGYAGPSCNTCASGFIPVTSGSTTTCKNVLPIADRRLVTQFDAAAPGTFTLAGDLVEIWNASRGDGVIWPESALAIRKPHYILLPPAVQFDGTQRMLSPTRTIVTGDNYTMFLVASWSPTLGRQTLLDTYYTAPDNFTEAFSLDAIDASTVRWRHRGPNDVSSDVVVSTSFHAAAGRQLIVVRRAPLGNSHVLTLSNGTNTVSAASPGGNFTAGHHTLLGHCQGEAIGQFCELDGNFYELMFYEGAMTGADVDSIEAYLREKWSL